MRLGLVFIVLTLLIINACTHGECHNVPQREIPSPSPEPSPTAVPSPTPAEVVIQEPTLLIFKATGERQCESSKGLALEDVKNQLVGHKITVYEGHTQADGLMHMALCGTPTGTIHVFSIPKKMINKAKALGFREFKPRK